MLSRSFLSCVLCSWFYLCACNVSSTADNPIVKQANVEPTNAQNIAIRTDAQTNNNNRSKNIATEKRVTGKSQCLANISDPGGKLPRVIVEGRTCLREQMPDAVLSEIKKSAEREYVEYSLSVALQPSNPDDDKNPRFERHYTFTGSKDENGKVYDWQNADEIEDGWTFVKKGKAWEFKGRDR